MKRNVSAKNQSKYASRFAKVVIDRGFNLLGVYQNSATKVSMRCPEGHIFEVTPNHFKNGSGCPHCKTIKAKMPEEEVLRIIEKECLKYGYTFRGFCDGWRGIHKTNILLFCDKHNTLSKPKSLYHFLRGHGCMCCSKYKD